MINIEYLTNSTPPTVCAGIYMCACISKVSTCVNNSISPGLTCNSTLVGGTQVEHMFIIQGQTWHLCMKSALAAVLPALGNSIV